MTVIWEDPPEVTADNSWVEKLRPLMERPGEWARFDGFTCLEDARNTASDLLFARIRRPKGVWNFRTREVRNQPVLYVRYVSPKNPIGGDASTETP